MVEIHDMIKNYMKLITRHCCLREQSSRIRACYYHGGAVAVSVHDLAFADNFHVPRKDFQEKSTRETQIPGKKGVKPEYFFLLVCVFGGSGPFIFQTFLMELTKSSLLVLK